MCDTSKYGTIGGRSFTITGHGTSKQRLSPLRAAIGGTRGYTEDGSLWRPEPVDGHELALITRMLAHTIHNPRRTLSMSYEQIGNYSVSNLRMRVQDAFGAMFALRARPYWAERARA